LVAILKELRLMKKEMVAAKAEFNKKLVYLTQEIRSSTESYTDSIAVPHIAEAQQTILQPKEAKIAVAAGAHPVAEMPQTGGGGESMDVMEFTPLIPKCQRKRFKVVSKWSMAVSTLRHLRQILLQGNLWNCRIGLKLSTFIWQFVSKRTIRSCILLLTNFYPLILKRV
jgi:hypothetical protein